MNNELEGEIITAHITSKAGSFIGNIRYGDHVGGGWLRIERACAIVQGPNGSRGLSELGWVEVSGDALMTVRELRHTTPLYQDYVATVSGLVTPDAATMAKVNRG